MVSGDLFENAARHIGACLDHAFENELAIGTCEDKAAHTRSAAALQQHVKQLFSANTFEGQQKKAHDWQLFCRCLFGTAVVALDDMQWPPTCDDWVACLINLRPRLSSYKRFRGVIGNVCEVAARYFGAEHCRHGNAQGVLDPRIAHAAMHYKTMCMLKRQYYMGLRQVRGIDMQESLNGTNFVDVKSMRGLSMAAAFSIGCVLGGRRPRALTALRLEHLTFTVCQADFKGKCVLVPGVRVTFPEEKFDDEQGARFGTEDCAYDDCYFD